MFENIQQEVVLLLAEKTPEIESGIDVVELDDAEDLPGHEVKLRARHHLKAIDHGAEKWTQYYLEEREIGLLRALKTHPLLTRFGQLGCVDVGVVTGNNPFFRADRGTSSNARSDGTYSASGGANGAASRAFCTPKKIGRQIGRTGFSATC